MNEVYTAKNSVMISVYLSFSNQAKSLISSVSSLALRHCLKAASEKGTSAWLTALSLQHHGFALHKGAFRNVFS